MTTLLIKIDNPGSLKLETESPRDNFWYTLAMRTGGSEAFGDGWVRDMWARAKQVAEDRRKISKEVAEYRGMRESKTIDSGESFEFDRVNFENRIRTQFPRRLRDELLKRLNSRQRIDGLDLRFACLDISYDSLVALFAAFGVEKTAALHGLAMPVMLSIIEASVPVALREILQLPSDIDFDVSISEVSEEDVLASPSAETPESKVGTPRLAMANASRAVSLLTASYVGPILLGMGVLYFAASAAQDAMKEASTERLTLMQGYADLTKQQLIALSDERRDMAKAAQEIVKAIEVERATLAQVYSDLMKQQVTAVSDERKEIAALVQDANTDRVALVEALRKIATDEHDESVRREVRVREGD
jgi:hypothetical protein